MLPGHDERSVFLNQQPKGCNPAPEQRHVAAPGRCEGRLRVQLKKQKARYFLDSRLFSI